MRPKKSMNQRHVSGRVGSRGRSFGVRVPILLYLVLLSMLLPTYVNAGETQTTGVVSNHIHENDYDARAKVADCYIVNNNDGSFGRVENMGDIILVENYTAAFQLISQRFVTMELPRFGGCYSGRNYNYIIFGQDNPGHDDGLEVYRIVYYSKEWTRLGSTSIRQCDTSEVFYGCNTDFAEYGDRLYIRMGHKSYGGQQELVTLSTRVTDCKLLEIQDRQAMGSYANVAATYIDASDGVASAADHLLGSPHALLFMTYQGAAVGGGYAYAQAFALRGAADTETPLTNVGGYACSGQYRIMVGSTDALDGSSPNRNIYIAAASKNEFNSGTVKLAFATGYAYGDIYSATRPYLVKIDNDHFVVIWELRSGYSELETINYVYVNGYGQMTSPVQSMHGCLSDCQPVLIGNQVVWYTTNGRTMTLYSIPATSGVQFSSQTAKAAVMYRGVDYSAVYDFAYYINRYPDMRVLYANDAEGALRHFVTYGINEGRQGSDNFDVYAYARYNADLRNAFGSNLRLYYQHFIQSGAAEGRRAR